VLIVSAKENTSMKPTKPKFYLRNVQTQTAFALLLTRALIPAKRPCVYGTFSVMPLVLGLKADLLYKRRDSRENVVLVE
jgi:hypothetical protein